MADVAITQGESIEKAIPAALEHLPLPSLVAGRRVAIKPNETLHFPALSLQEAIGRFTEAAYGHRLDFEHA